MGAGLLVLGFMGWFILFVFPSPNQIILSRQSGKMLKYRRPLLSEAELLSYEYPIEQIVSCYVEEHTVRNARGFHQKIFEPTVQLAIEGEVVDYPFLNASSRKEAERMVREVNSFLAKEKDLVVLTENLIFFKVWGALLFVIYLAITISYLYRSYGHYLPDFGNGAEVAVTVDLNHS